MTRFDAAARREPLLAWENEGGALPHCTRAAAPQAASWRTLATLGAVMAAWPDLSIGVRRRIAYDAVAAMGRPEARDDRRA